MVRTAIVILNWNGLEHLKRFLGVLVKNSLSEGSAVYLSDNGSTDGSVEWVVQNYPGINIIRLDKNYGFAGGYNRTFEKISAEYYVLINSDVEVTPGWIASLVSFMDKNPEAAACQPKILSWERRKYFEHAGAAGGYLDKYGYPFCRGRLFNHCEKDLGQYDSVAEVFWTSGACMIIRSEAWHESGGLDPDFFAHMEEIDLCWRLLLSGRRLFYNPEAVVYHVGGGALPYDSHFKMYLNFRNNLFMLYKNLPVRTMSATLFTRKMLDGVSAIRFLLIGKFRNVSAIWKAHIDYYRVSDKLKIKRNAVKRSFEENPSRVILNKSVVFEFYIKFNRTFKSLKTNF